MRPLSSTKRLLLKRSKIYYNNSQYRSARRTSRLAFIFFKDPKILDIIARSELMLNLNKQASSRYFHANKKGILLKNHYQNHCKSLIAINEFTKAYKIASLNISNNKKYLNLLCVQLKKIPDNLRFDILEQMSLIYPLPDLLEELMPWPSEKLHLVSKDNNRRKIFSGTDIYKRELNNIKNSGEYRVGKLLSDYSSSPLKWPILPLKISSLVYQIYNEKKGLIGKKGHEYSNFYNNDRKNNCIVMFPTNGVGFGHFTRLLALANKLKKSDPNLEIIFFTTMPVLHILSESGYPSYHISGRKKYYEMTTSEWNSMATEILSLIFSIHKPKAFIFDGTFPYRGMLNAIKTEPNIKKIWVRRKTIANAKSSIPIDSFAHFDSIIRPGDVIEGEDDSNIPDNIELFDCAPITLIDTIKKEKKGQLRNRLGIPAEAMLCYIQLGAGAINDISEDLKITLQVISEIDSLYAVVGESMLGTRIKINNPKVRILRDYPNSIYFDDFNFCIMAAGYNSFHEVIKYGLPTICLPNLNTGRDDQLSRAMYGKDLGSMIVLKEINHESIRSAVNRMMNKRLLKIMESKALESRLQDDGVNDLSEWILERI